MGPMSLEGLLNLASLSSRKIMMKGNAANIQADRSRQVACMFAAFPIIAFVVRSNSFFIYSSGNWIMMALPLICTG